MNFRKTILPVMAAAALTACTSTSAASTTASASTSNETETAAMTETTPVEMVDVTTDAGTLRGLLDNGLYSFRGVPYATAERFKMPVAVTSYDSEIQLALSYGTVSPQDRGLDGTGAVNDHEFMTPSNGTADMVANENCQNLNVWTNSLDGSKPVIVFFHGGGLSNGASSELSYYTGEYFAETYDAVFVSVNHRLNVLGYLDLSDYGEEYASSGIAGMEDCVEALKWVQNNIAQFGGDPSNVTIIGQSGGGQKVTTLACMSDTVGLFDKVVVMSGGYSSTPQETYKENTKKLVESLGLAEDEVVSTLTSMSYEDLYNAAVAAGCSFSTAYGTGTFTAPLFDENGVMNEYAAQRTWMVGTSFSEFSDNGGQVIYSMNADATLQKTDEEAMEMLTEKYGDNAQAFADAFAAAYPDHPLIESLYLSAMPASSTMQRAGLISATLDKFSANGTSVYNYVSAYTQPYCGGATMHHTADIPYFFNSIDTVEYLISGDETNAHTVASFASASLFSFMQDGDPSTDAMEWKAWTANEHNTMIIDATPECKADADTELYNLMFAE